MSDDAADARPFARQPDEEGVVGFGDIDPAVLAQATTAPPVMVQVTDPSGNSFSWPLSEDLPSVYVPGLGRVHVSLERVLPGVGSIIEVGPEDDDTAATRWWRASGDAWLLEGSAANDPEAGVMLNTETITAKGDLYGWRVVFDATR